MCSLVSNYKGGENTRRGGEKRKRKRPIGHQKRPRSLEKAAPRKKAAPNTRKSELSFSPRFPHTRPIEELAHKAVNVKRERGYIWLSTSEEKRSVAELSFPMEIVYQQRSDGARCRIEEQSSHPLAHDAALFYFFSR